MHTYLYTVFKATDINLLQLRYAVRERRSKVRYNPEEAIQHILDPGSDSELSELSSDHEYLDEPVPALCEPEALEEETVNETNSKKSDEADKVEDSVLLLYRRPCVLRKVPKKQRQPLLDFCLEISASLIKCGKSGITRKVGRPSLEEAEIRAKAEKQGRKPDTPLLAKAIRLDTTHQWPEYKDTKNHCRHCKTGFSRVYYDKCTVCLCLSNARNYF